MQLDTFPWGKETSDPRETSSVVFLSAVLWPGRSNLVRARTYPSLPFCLAVGHALPYLHWPGKKPVWFEARSLLGGGKLGAISPGLDMEGTAPLQGSDPSPCPCMGADTVLF